MNKSICQSALTSSVRRAILKSSVVSFDIFDTLLLRPYIRPTDLFLHIEKAHHRPFFHDCRIAAEIAAREHTSAQDVTLDEIYEQIDNNFKDLKNVELDWERMVLRANPQMREVYDFAKENGKRIVIASDMYLPTKFIADLLHKNGFDGYEKLYVSSEIGATKANGSMFDRIIEDMNVAPDKILHIGDNRKSDYKNPRKHGIRAILYPAPIWHYIKHNPRIEKFYDKGHNDIGPSILIAMLAYRDLTTTDDNYWHNLGYEYAGPVIYGYTRWIESVAHQNNISHLMFVARDGYTLQRVFNIFNNDIKNSYVYAPRFLNLICRLDYTPQDQSQSSAIIEYFSGKSSEITSLRKAHQFNTWQDYHCFIQNNIKLFQALANTEYKQYKKYLLSKVNKTSNIGIVDTITIRLSSQKLLENILNCKTLGFYWTRNIDVWNTPTIPTKYNHTLFLNRDLPYQDKQTKNWNFMEFIMTAPEYPIKNITPDGKPVYDSSPSDAEKIRKKLYPYISDGSVDFTNDVNALFNSADIYLSGPDLVNWVNCLCDYPTKTDFKNMSKIQHSWGSAHKNYQPLFCYKTPLVQYFTHPQRSKRIARDCIWRTPLQSFISAIITPIKIKMHGLKQIRILLCPRLYHTYVNLSVRISPKCFYQIVFGKPVDVQ